MLNDINKKYEELCKQLGDLQFKKVKIEENIKLVVESIESLNKLAASLPRVNQEEALENWKKKREEEQGSKVETDVKSPI